MIEWKQRVQKLRRFDVETTEKSTWKTNRYFVNFEIRIQVEISTSNHYHNFHVDSPFKISEISANFPWGISTSNRWKIDEDVSIEAQVGFFLWYISDEGCYGKTANAFKISARSNSRIIRRLSSGVTKFLIA